MDAYGKIRTVNFTPAAPGALVRINESRGSLIVQSNALARAKSSTDTAGFAPIAEDIYLETLPLGWLRFSCRAPSFFPGFVRAPALARSRRITRLLIAFHMSSN
jgi:hypothetical protein